ncbi:MAG: sigma 54-interacting transcriptional regulator [Pseudomonadota bacterium]
MSLNFIIVNDDQDFAGSLSQILELDDHTVTHYRTPKAALDGMGGAFDGIIFVDYSERKMPVTEFLAELEKIDGATRAIVTATPEQVSAAKAFPDTILMGVLAKPIDFDELDSLLTLAPMPGETVAEEEEAEAPAETKQEVEETQLAEAVTLKEPVHVEPEVQAARDEARRDPLVVIGHSEIAKRLHKEWQQLFGRTDDIALIGDKGVGKSSFIRALEMPGPIVEVQCARLDRKTSDRELFGQDEQGLNLSGREESFLDQALGGTLVLFDVEQLPPSTQDALQRVVKTRQEMAAAGNAKLFDFRLIVTSTFDLRELAAQRKFSPMLLEAISPVFVEIPSLRERGIDPVMMFEVAMNLAADELQVTCPEMTPKLASALSAYNWPGNLRELRQAARNYVMEQTGASNGEDGTQGEVISLANTRRA